ncbi:MAG: AMP phosphorylase [Candidatus Micrarchaeota archaeon]
MVRKKHHKKAARAEKKHVIKEYDQEGKEEKKVDVWQFKKYECEVKPINIFTGKHIIVLNESEAKEHDMYSGYRALLKAGKKIIVVTVDVSDEFTAPGSVGVFMDTVKQFNLKKGERIELIHMNRPKSIAYIKKKMDKGVLTTDEVKTVVGEIMDGKLDEIETSAWISAAYINGFADEEIIALAEATVESGDSLDIGKKIVMDKHCIGGVAGNRTTMIIVPIIAAAGLYIPKTSSRSITSAAGTADTMEVLSNVSFNLDEMKRIVTKAKGAIVWGGGMNLAPVDDKLIRIRHPLSLDPRGMLLASILGKKKSVGATHVVIDIPIGRGVKVPYLEKGEDLGKHFIEIGRRLGMQIEVLITDGAEPIGNGVGPVLECIDVLEVLEGRGPDDLRHKSIMMAGRLLESCGKVSRGHGYSAAETLIDSGKALKKFKEIVELQGGNPKVKASDLQAGGYSYTVKAEKGGSVFHIDNKVISKVARIAGSPRDQGAGILLHSARGKRVEPGDKLFTIFAESEPKLGFALKALENLEPIEMRKMLLGTMV